MSVSVPAAAKANGLSTVINTIAAPGEAFQTLGEAPTWGWALIVVLVLLVGGLVLQGPALRHAAVTTTQHMLATNTTMASLPDDKKAQMLARAGGTSPWTYVFPIVGVFVAVLLNTIVMLIGNALGGGKTGFKHLWAGSMNIAVPTIGIGTVVLGVITMLRGPDSFGNSFDIARAMPGLAMLVPHANMVVGGALSAISIFTIWGVFLNATMLRVMARTSAGVAWTFAVIVALGGALLAALAAATLTALHLV